jgi:hypothetical protein
MADYSNTKGHLGAVFVSGTKESTRPDCEPLITPGDLKDIYLAGIQLYYGWKDPVTGKAKPIEDPQIAKFIDKAISKAEALTNVTIFEHQIEERLQFDYSEYKSFGYMRVSHGPVSSVEKLAIIPSNGIELFNVPIEWIDQGQFKHRQINIVPLTYAIQTGQVSAGFYSSYSGINHLFALIGAGYNWIPSYWQITYTVGFPRGEIPKMINNLIGILAAIDILSSLAAARPGTSSSSLSIDNMSQSISGAGQDIYRQRIEDLVADKDVMIGKIKAKFRTKYNADNF